MTGTVLITGCSSGFGAAATKLFASRGWNVIATMRNPDDGQTLADLKNVLVVRLDVQDRDSVDKAITAGIGHFGHIDAVVNRSGTIINMSSGGGVFGAAMGSIYCASKFALEGFSEALAYELAGFGIKVKIIEPGVAFGTGFAARSQAEGSRVPLPADYNAFVAHAAQIYGGMAANSEADAVGKVVQAIFAAATDGTHQLRYMPTDDIRLILTARRESSEQDFIAMVRGFFLPRPSTNA
jgi:NAD(P)-dependent dehydrogenase (short-subunit alcohol dehydrogenase family)